MHDLLLQIQSLEIFSLPIILLLIIAGFAVGFINTIAGSGTVITYSLFMFLGLPAPYANGTIRFGVIMQTLAASLTFKKQGVLHLRKGFLLALPTVLGSIAGAQIAVNIDKEIFEKVIAGVMLLMVFFIFYNPKTWLEGRSSLQEKKLNWKQILLFFAIGIYGGFIHIGVGIFLLAALVLSAGYDLVKANALKVFIVFLYSPFALLVFMLNHHVDYGMGAIASIGNVLGGIVASHFAVSWGARFVRWALILIILGFSSKLLGILTL
jgi:uncharacterized membrane protein YfcA